MLNRKTKRLIAKLLVGLGIFSVCFGTTVALTRKAPQEPQPIVIENTKELKVEVREVKIEEIKDCLQKLQFREYNMSELHTYEPSSKFVKGCNAKYYFDVKVSLDLTNLKNEQIVVNGDNVRIYVKGFGTDVVCLENKTQFSELDNGWFDFKEFKITPEKQNEVIGQLKEVVKDKVILTEQADILNSAEKSMEMLLSKLINRNITVDIIVIG